MLICLIYDNFSMKPIYIFLSLLLLIVSCNNKPENVIKIDDYPPIYPDYVGVTIPAKIAPMNFNIKNAEAVDVDVKGSKSGSLHINDKYANFPIGGWRKLISDNKGGKIVFEVKAKIDGKWYGYKDFEMLVSDYPLDEYGITYRRISPGYEVFGKMGLYQREISTFNEFPIIENTLIPGNCVNCHTSNACNPDNYTFHVRGANGATLVHYDNKTDILQSKNTTAGGSMVYPYWHPSGKYCAYSTNDTHQSFHVVKEELIEVFDLKSDIFIYCPETHELIMDSCLMTKDNFETYPAFSPDGKTLYFCTSKAYDIPENYKKIKYNLCKIAFNDGKFSGPIDTLFNAVAMDKNCTFAKPSYDGKYIMFTLSDYGCFPIWHHESDLWLLDLQTNKARPLNEVNSNDTESTHNWSTGSHWFVFVSRRENGLYSQPFFSCIDDNGKASKPFLLPQKNPLEYYSTTTYSFNIPDFTTKKVDIDYHSIGNKLMSNERIMTTTR